MGSMICLYLEREYREIDPELEERIDECLEILEKEFDKMMDEITRDIPKFSIQGDISYCNYNPNKQQEEN